jgi:hypothetical protein
LEGSTGCPHDLRPGSLINDHYLVEEVLDCDGMAIMLRVTDRTAGTLCLLKVLKPELLHGE